jgi:hypothetical protein
MFLTQELFQSVIGTSEVESNALSDKSANLKPHVALHFAYSNSVRIHETLRYASAMAVGLTHRLRNQRELITAKEYGRQAS